MRPDMQVRLLRAIEMREIQRLGGNKRIKVDVRIITATNRNLRERVAAGAFREDLFYRIAVYRMTLPALSERENDVVELAERFAVEFSSKFHKRGLRLSSQACVLLRNYSWPGNVRQLRNAIERATLLAQGPQVEPGDLPDEVTRGADSAHGSQDGARGIAASPSRRVRVAAAPSHYSREDEILTMEAEEKRILARALRITKGDVSEAARKLQIGRATLYRRIKELNLSNGA